MSFEEMLKYIKSKFSEYSNGWIVEDIEGTEEVEYIEEVVGEQSRWSIFKECIYKYKDRYFAISWSSPATEFQEGQGTYPEIYEVEPVEITKTIYKSK